ncbi:MAG: manganese efflux pump MntP family protein [Bacteroidales bacterium]
MDLVTIFLIAFGLTVDSLAVSISTGLMVTHIRFWQAMRIAFILSLVQGIMPLIGWFLGNQVKDAIIEYDHWIAFALLAAIGTKMLYESLRSEEEKKDFNPLKFSVVLGLAVATSIDALVVGVSFAFINADILLSIFIIGFLTGLVSMIGMLAGKKLGNFFGQKVEFIGGLVLIAMGLKIFIEHVAH